MGRYFTPSFNCYFIDWLKELRYNLRATLYCWCIW